VSSETKFTSFGETQHARTPSHHSSELDEHSQDVAAFSPEKARSHKELFLLTRSQGVQTDSWPGLLSPSPQPSVGLPSSPSQNDPRSESSSLADNMQSSVISILLERVVSLLNRLTQADALTLTNRLKRQHLRGDVGHLSRTTVGGIISEVATLRTQFRPHLEDHNAIITCTRKDLRGLFQLFKDFFMEMGAMRVTLNDVILDPKVAYKVRMSVMDPMNAQKDGEATGPSSSGWMAPISKLFGSANVSGEDGQAVASPSPTIQTSNQRGAGRPPPRVIPKLEPALAASATTVNVEFSGNGVGRSVTSTFSAVPRREEDHTLRPKGPSGGNVVASKQLMGIFAGAPKNVSTDPWVVLPDGVQRAPSTRLNANAGGPSHHRMSRNVDAVIDVNSPQEGEESDFRPHLLQRTLRRRGLSDSSIHSTFANQEDEPELAPHAVLHGGLSARQAAPDKASVLQSLSRTVQSFRFATGGQTGGRGPPPKGTSSGTRRPLSTQAGPSHRVAPSVTSFVPPWEAGTALGRDAFFVGSRHVTEEDGFRT
jgi:hypothetical protein